MHRSPKILLLLASLVASLAACDLEQPPVNRVGPNVVDKSLFTGSWYYNRVVIDVDYEAASIGTFPGDTAYDFSQGLGFSLPRVRWIIDEDTLFAYRDYELIEGLLPASDGANPAEELGEPVAAWRIESHFDIRRAYSPTTGEEENVVIENRTDRRWWERQYMRVDWSQNLLPAYYGQISNLEEIFGSYVREPAGLFVQGASDFPDSWRPRFDFMECEGLEDASERCLRSGRGARELAEDYEAGDLYHMSFVTQELVSPGLVRDPFTGQLTNYCQTAFTDAPICTTTAVFVRNSFLKVSDSRQYVAENWDDGRFDRHGYFRNERPVFDRSTGPGDPSFGVTDFMNYNVNRQNIWRDWYEVDELGGPLLDENGQRRMVPYAERRIRRNVWTTTPEMPAHLMGPSFDVVAQWNAVLMETVRNLRGETSPAYARVACQSEDPDGYCHCTADPERPGEVLNPTCPGVYDPLLSPEEVRAAGTITNGAEPFDCHVEVTDALDAFDWDKPDLSDRDFHAWYDARFVGDECVMTLEVNTCHQAAIAANGGTTAGLDCEERGDLRYRFFSYVSQPGTRFLGVATLRGDPISGEIISGDANIGGPALDGYRTFALQTLDLVNGDISDREFLIGEDIRAYVDNLNRAVPPAAPQEPFLPAPTFAGGMPSAPGVDHGSILRRMEAFAGRADRLAGPEGRGNIYRDRLRELAGTDIEQRLLGSPDMLALAGVDTLNAGFDFGDVPEGIALRTSPFRAGASPMEQLTYQFETERQVGEANVMMPNEYVDHSVLEFANRHRDWPRARLEIALNQLLFYQTQLHELGHCLGLRHSFGASTDIPNYDAEYHAIDARFPYPDARDFDADGDQGLNADEQARYEAAYADIKETRELAGADRWMTSSIMEYTAQWYERTQTGAYGPGSYDVAAIAFGYGDVVEYYENMERRPVREINLSNTPKRWARYYRGGESCAVDAECPFARDGSRAAELTPGQAEAGLTQRCQPHPNGTAFGRICSNFDQDAAALIPSEDATPAFAPVEYRFCTDDRVGTYAWCHRFDEGDSYREIVRNTQEQYERQYIFTNFRRYRRNFTSGGYLFDRLIGRQYMTLQAIFQNLMFNYQADPEYREITGPFGFDDHFLAAADTMNFYARVISQPEIGSFAFSDVQNRYVSISDDPDARGAQIRLPLGAARYFGSEYQTTLSGITRLELIGTFAEKFRTMAMLTQRGFVTSYTRDVPFWTNFYDLFPGEMESLFRGLIADESAAVGPRVACAEGTFPNCTQPQLIYPDLYLGDCTDGPGTPGCRPGVEERYADLPTIDGDMITTLRYWAMIWSLAGFPVFFDTRYENQLYVCAEGNGACFDIAEDDVAYELGETTAEVSDYVRYDAIRYGQSFVARRIETRAGLPEGTEPAFSLLKKLQEENYLLEILKRYRGDEGGPAYDAQNLRDIDTARLDALGFEISFREELVDDQIDELEREVPEQENLVFALMELLRRFRVNGWGAL